MRMNVHSHLLGRMEWDRQGLAKSVTDCRLATRPRSTARPITDVFNKRSEPLWRSVDPRHATRPGSRPVPGRSSFELLSDRARKKQALGIA